MSKLSNQIEALGKHPAGKLGSRVLMELRYALEVSKVDGGQWDSLIAGAVQLVEDTARRDGALTDAAALQAEEHLLPMQAAAKRYTVLCVGHAHIDMNWMWRYDETVSITLETFRTVLNLMAEYPDFRFSQSQASVYEIVEKYDPAMLDEIRQRVAEGRWEVSASTWVEADRNMPSGESVARHLLYTRRYLSQLLNINGETLNIDYEPDTFGHGALVPEMLAQGGVKYYYHCRGDNNQPLYRWRSATGAEVLCYREPFWYLGPIQQDFALAAPVYCQHYSINTHMRVYGVGDHGGGPTRRDIELLLDMAAWPIYPQMRFGTYREFFAEAEKAKDLPVVEGELNCIFTGCYTSQARITQANRFGEARLDEAEKFSAMAALQAGAPYAAGDFERAWRNVLFNQFHDILPGSGVIDTREHALGIFQDSMAVAGTQTMKALRALGARADTSTWLDGATGPEDASEGGGVGFGVGFGMAGMTSGGPGSAQPFRISQTERGRGVNRIYHVFNPAAFARTEVVELTVFDWPGDYARLRIAGANGEALPFQILDKEPQSYWQHRYVRVLVQLGLPAGGRHTIAVTQDEDIEMSGPRLPDVPDPLRKEEPFSFILENEHLHAEFNPNTGVLMSLVDKETGAELVDRPSAFFRLIHEQPAINTAGTAWTVGRYRSVQPMTGDAEMLRALDGPLKNAIAFTARAGASTVHYTVSLATGARCLEMDCDVHWREVGEPGKATPQLNFTLPLARLEGDYIQDVPGGIIQRAAVGQDVPCQSFAAARCGGGKAVVLLSDSKYGFRCEQDKWTKKASISLDCLRASSDPDPYPEFGRHHFRIGIALSGCSHLQLLRTSYAFCHPALTVSDLPHKGSYPLAEDGIAVDGAHLQAAKLAEDGTGLVLRLARGEDTDGTATVNLWHGAEKAVWVDTHENALDSNGLAVQNGVLNVPLKANSTRSVKIGRTLALVK